MKKREKVIILGGGVAGMSAAHELAERGFDVEVYERLDIPGGKARSMPVLGSGRQGRKPLPGEHGFRFFPGFYQHITDTMKRIPYGNNAQGVFDNLVDATHISIPRFDQAGLTLPATVPKNYRDVKLLVDVFLQLISNQIELKEEDVTFFAQKLWQLITSCKERRINEYEKIDWWTFVEAEGRSDAYQKLLAKGLTESLVASKAKLASTKTVGDIFLQLLFDLIDPTISTDRLLNGPTNEVWINPWLTYLKALGVNYHFHSQVDSINYAGGLIKSVTIKDLTTQQPAYEVEGDYYIAALPVEVIDRLIVKGKLDRYDPAFADIRALAKHTNWMNGIQFYLKEDVPIARGHVLLVDTPWALTAISQKQFWADIDLSEYGDGQVKGILSVVVSDWGLEGDEKESLGLNGKFANQCTNEEIMAEVWAELQKSLNVNGQEILTDENLHSWFLDPAIHDPTKLALERINECVRLKYSEPASQGETRGEIENFSENPSESFSKKDLLEFIAEPDENVRGEEKAVETFPKAAKTSLQTLVDLGAVEEIEEQGKLRYQVMLNIERNNAEPLLVNEVNTWKLRPNASINISNLFLASDYVRTNTDLATMEGANEAARRAVNAIIGASGRALRPCKIWELHEPEIFAPLRWRDSVRYRQGLPWKSTWT